MDIHEQIDEVLYGKCKKKPKRKNKRRYYFFGTCLVFFILFAVMGLPLLQRKETVEELIESEMDLETAGSWVIDNDTVFYNSSKGYLSASPHTITNDGWVEFELESYNYSGDVEAFWLFQTDLIKPKHPHIWRNITHNLTGYNITEQWGNITITNISEWTNLGIANYDDYDVVWGNENNTKLFEVNYSDEAGGTFSDVIAFTSYEGNTTLATFFGNDNVTEYYTYTEKYFDWTPLNKDITKRNVSWQGYNKMYNVTANITSGKRYKIRAWIDIKFNTNGKYLWGVKKPAWDFNDNRTIILDPWFDSDFRYYKKITIESDYIDSDITNYPLYVNSTNATMIALMDDGDSIRPISTDNTTEFSYEIESIGSNYLNMWVNISETITSGSDYTFLIYYNNSEATDNQNPTEVWGNRYEAVFHCNESATSDLYDTTSNHIHLGISGDNIASVSAVCGMGRESYTVNEEFYRGSDFANWEPQNDSIVYSFWFYYPSDQSDAIFYIPLQGANGLEISHGGANGLFFRVYDNSSDGEYEYWDNYYRDGFAYYTAILNRTSDQLETYINDSKDPTIEDISHHHWYNTHDSQILFLDGDPSENMTVDEFRIHRHIKKDAEIKAEFHNMNQSSHLNDFLSWGTEIDLQGFNWWDNNWHSARVITVESDYIDNSLENYPLLVVLDNSTGDYIFRNEHDMRFRDYDNTTSYNYEIEEFNNSGNTYVWVNISTPLTAGQDFNFIVYFNNTGATDGENIEGTWDVNFTAIHHLNESNSTAANHFKDSTSNNQDGQLTDANGDCISQDGLIGDCINFSTSSATGDLINIGAIDHVQPISYSSWYNENLQDSRNFSIGRYYGGYALGQWNTGDGVGRWNIYVDGATQFHVDSCTDNEEWSFMTVTFNGSDALFYHNDVLEHTNSTGGALSQTASPWYIGEGGFGAGRWFWGRVDECRWSNSVRNASWIKADFHSQNQSTHLGNFLTFREVQHIPGAVSPTPSRSWQSVMFWEVSFSNTTSTEPVLDWTISFSNTTVYDPVIDWEISFGNSTVYDPVIDWEISFSNFTAYEPVIDWTISFGNRTAFEPVLDFNISFGNSLTFDPVLDWEISFSNSTAYEPVLDFNISFSNSSTERYWQGVIDWNISFGNGTAFEPVLDFNISFGNSTTLDVTIQMLYPTNESNITSLQPTLRVNLTSADGSTMNYTVYNGTYVIFNGSNVGNGTYTGLWSNVTDFQQYNYTVDVLADGTWFNSSFFFTTQQAGGGQGIRTGFGAAIGIAAGAMMLVIAFAFGIHKRRKKI